MYLIKFSDKLTMEKEQMRLFNTNKLPENFNKFNN
jgi:hypothetical protein